MAATMRRLHLHGGLGDGLAAADGTPVPTPFVNAAATPAKMIRLLAAQVPAFRDRLQRGRFELIRGTIGESAALALDETTMHVTLGRTTDVHLVPVIEGEGGRTGKAAAKIVLGVALIGTGVAGAAGVFGATATGGFSFATQVPGLAGVITYGNLVATGSGLLLSGVSNLLSPQPGVQDYRAREVDKRESFYFNGGPSNFGEQGHPVPLIFGRFRVGGIAISAGLRVEELPA